MSEAKVTRNMLDRTMTVSADFGTENDVQAIIEGIKDRVVIALVNRFVEKYGEEILAEIDLEAIKKKTNDQVTVAALRELVK